MPEYKTQEELQAEIASLLDDAEPIIARVETIDPNAKTKRGYSVMVRHAWGETNWRIDNAMKLYRANCRRVDLHAAWQRACDLDQRLANLQRDAKWKREGYQRITLLNGNYRWEKEE